jgi:hypothetical protein
VAATDSTPRTTRAIAGSDELTLLRRGRGISRPPASRDAPRRAPSAC